MRPDMICAILIALFSTVVVSHSATDPQRQLADERRQTVRPLAAPAPPAQPAVQQSPASQRSRERSQAQRSASGGSQGRGGINQPQSVSIDQLKVQSDTPVEYQFEALQTLNVQDGEPVRSVEEVKAGETESAEAEQQSETSAEEGAAEYEETSPEEPEEEISPVVERVIQPGAGHSLFRIIEDEHRIVVMQVEMSSSGMKQTR